jgi:preprotein translocase subunit YajC
MFPCLAQDAGAASPSGPAPGSGGCGGDPTFLVLMLGMVLIWWFLVLRPQSKAEKARRAKLDAIEKGDRVRTRGGIEGVVSRVQDDKVIVRIDVEGKVHVPFAKAYIEDVLSEEPAEPASEKSS